VDFHPGKGSVNSKNLPYSVTPAVVFEVLRNTLPFSELENRTLEDVARKWVIDFFPQGTLILLEGITDVMHLHLIQKGAVKTYLTGSLPGPILKDYSCEGETFGATSILLRRKADFNVETMEDTFCFLLPKDDLLDLVREYPRFERFYLNPISEDLMSSAYAELRDEHMRPGRRKSVHLFSYQVSDIVKNQPQMVPSSTTIQEAASRMTRLGIGSLLVGDDPYSIAGIVTDTDMRSKVVAAALDGNVTLESIMASPVLTIPAHATCFEALLTMMQEQVDHLAVKHLNEIIGMVTTHDMMVFQGVSPTYLFRETVTPKSIEGLCTLSQRIPNLVRALLEQGAKACEITPMITVLNDRILSGILDFLQQEIGPAPVSFCWITLGSNGRKEQILKADQGNALIYEDPANDHERQAAEAYFETLSRLTLDRLVDCGYPVCRNGLMASNPSWRKPISVWRNYFSSWICTPDPQEASLAVPFFDFRPDAGTVSLGQELRKQVISLAERQTVFMTHIAGDCLLNWPPLSFFRHFVVEKNGHQRNRLDIKTRGLGPFVNFARLLALRQGISETNTLRRLQLLMDNGSYPKEFYSDVREAYEFLMQLLLVRQLEMIESGMLPENFIDPAELTELERKMLKEVFSVINRMLGYVKQQFPIAI
jgi:CBS domain-containing protein